jgi:hypothetical protein
MKWKIYRKSDMKKMSEYESDVKLDSAKHWSHLMVSPNAVHLPVPEGADPECVELVWVEEVTDQETGEVTPAHYELQEDADLVTAKKQKIRNQKLEKLRDFRKPKLNKADDQIKKHEDSDLNAVATKAEWQAYRIYLRNMTDNYKYVSDNSKGKATLDSYAEDMSDFSDWPVEPS